jgi:hypothetical protein
VLLDCDASFENNNVFYIMIFNKETDILCVFLFNVFKKEIFDLG